MDYYHTSFSSGDHQSYSSTPPHVLMMNNNNNNQIQMVGGEIKKKSSSFSTSSSLKKEIRGKKNSTSSSSSSKSGGGVRLSTDPQSVAARERRHRISERFKILQSLVPGGSKMDTVSMLEEAIHYVKFLKTQISLHQSIINNNLINNINHEIHNLINEYPSSSSSFDDHLLLFPNTTTTSTSSYNDHHQLEEEEEQPVIRPYCSLISNSDDNAVVPVVGVQEQIPAPFCYQDDHLHETMFLHEGHYYSISNY